MNITINTQILAGELRLLNQVVPAKAPLPVLANTLIHADMGGVRFAATDLDIAFVTACRAHVEQPGTVTLPVKRLLDITEQLPDTDITISSDKHHVNIQSGSFRGRLQTLPSDDFPTLTPVTGEPSVLPTALLQAMIRRVRYAINNSGKFIVNGALFTLTDGVAAMVATDGKRLSVTTMQRKGPELSVVVPTKTLDALLSLFSESQLTFSQSERHLFFQAGERLLISRTLETKFPAYERVIPRENPRRANLDRAQLSAALRRVGLVSEDDQACYFSFERGFLDLSAASASVGEAAERIGTNYDGEAFKICCNWQHVLDFLDAAENQTVRLDLKDIHTPMLLTDGDNHLGVVMLMRM